MTADARVLQFPTAVGTGDYGRFSRELSDDELAGCFFFTDDDRARIAVRRSEINRLGFALQLGTVRYLGRFLENPVEVPASVLGWTARELAVPLSVSLVEYGRGRTRFDHQAEICAAYGYRPFDTAGVEREFVGWLQARAWVRPVRNIGTESPAKRCCGYRAGWWSRSRGASEKRPTAVS